MAQFYLDGANVTNFQNDNSENSASDDSLLLEESTSTDNKWQANDEATFVVPIVAHHEANFNGVSCNNAPEGVNRGEWNLWQDGQFRKNLRSSGSDRVHSSFVPDDTDVDVPLLATDGLTTDTRIIHCHSLMLRPTNKSAWHNLLAVSVLCFIFMVVEITGGYLAGSTAVMTDAAHLFSDLIGFLVSLSAIAISQYPPTKTFSFGFCRLEVLGALVSTWIIWVLSFVFLYVAIHRIVVADFNIEADTMMIVAFIGVVINIVMGYILHGACQLPHSHGHSHNSHQHLTDSDDIESESEAVHSHLTNINVRAAFIHVVGDLIQSIGVLTAALIIKFLGPPAYIADPICTMISSILVLLTTIPVLIDCGRVLLEGYPKNLDHQMVLSTLENLPHVRHVHSLHVWSLTVERLAMSVHLAVDQNTDRDQILQAALLCARNKFGVAHCTVQIENYDATSFADCLSCRPPLK